MVEIPTVNRLRKEFTVSSRSSATVGSPSSESELLWRARQLDGITAGQLARRLGFFLGDDTVHCKGKIGELVELALGATAGNKDQPDFPELGVELKTIPLDRFGRVRESTFVCSLDLNALEREEWETSRVRRKLSCVLWVPIEASSGVALPLRHLGTARLWRPTPAQEALVRDDWTELVGRIAIGGIDGITAQIGRCLQLRPKARDGAARRAARGPEGETLAVVPRGFYLRARFTEEILWS
jgi:DNA mismatch repair protein MutH